MIEHRASSEALQPRVPLRLVVLSILGLWAIYFALASLRGLTMGMESQAEMLWRRSIVAAAGLVLTLGIWATIRLFDRRPLWLRVLIATVLSFVVSVVLAWTNQAVFQPMEERYLQEQAAQYGLKAYRDERGNIVIEPADDSMADDGDPLAQSRIAALANEGNDASEWQRLIELAYGRFFLLLGWCAVYFAMLSAERARLAERRTAEFRQAARDAELRSLRYQVNPHFLFNTLNSLSALILTGKNEHAEAMVQSIASFYRRSLTDEPTTDTLVEEEFELQRSYLEIEAVRFPDRLKVAFVLPEALREARIPGMILQPLVENSVKYAVAESSRPVTITIAAREEFGRLVLSVCDDGPMGGEGLAGHGHGIGLRNVRQRLEARFGGDATVASGPTDTGYATHIRIPLAK